MATNNNINYGPAAIPGTVTTPVLGNNIDRAPAPVAPGAGTGYIPTVTQPVIPVTEQPVINPPIATRTTTAVIPVVEQSVAVVTDVTAGDTVAAGNQQRYITILANGTVVTNNASTLDFEGNGFTITTLGTNGAVITLSGAAGYGNSNVATLLAAFGSNTLSTTGNVTGGYILGNGSQLTGLAATYSNANVATFLASFGSNTIVTTGNVTGGNLLTGNIVNSANVTLTAGANSWTLDTTGNLYVPGSIILPPNTLITGNFASPAPRLANFDSVSAVDLSAAGNVTSLRISASGNVTCGNVLTGGLISATANIIGGNLITAGLFTATGNVTGGNVLTGGLISATSTITSAANITGGNVLTGGLVSATANITGGNILTAGVISATGSITSAGNLSLTGNIVDAGEMWINTSSNGNINLNPNGTGNVNIPAGVLSVTGNITGGNISATGNITGNTAGFAIGYRDIPQVSLSSNVTTALTDAGKHYYSTSASNLALTIANNTSVSWPVGTAISIVNRGTANITIAPGSGVSLYLAGNSTAGNRTVTTYGMATVMNVAANIWMINGTVV